MKAITALLNKTTMLVLLGLLLVLASGCQSDTSDHGSNGEQARLRAFNVPPGLAPELSTSVNDLLRRGDGPVIGRAMPGPSGQLLVSAPAGVLDGINDLIESLDVTRPAPAPIISITCWAVIGEDAKDAGWSEPLAEIRPALEVITEADGPKSFRLLEKLQLHSLSGEDGLARGRKLEMEQEASVLDGRIIAELRMMLMPSNGYLRSTISLDPDQLLVLGQTGVPVRTENGIAQDANLYFVVRARIESASS